MTPGRESGRLTRPLHGRDARAFHFLTISKASVLQDRVSVDISPVLTCDLLKVTFPESLSSSTRPVKTGMN